MRPSPSVCQFPFLTGHSSFLTNQSISQVREIQPFKYNNGGETVTEGAERGGTIFGWFIFKIFLSSALFTTLNLAALITIKIIDFFALKKTIWITFGIWPLPVSPLSLAEQLCDKNYRCSTGWLAWVAGVWRVAIVRFLNKHVNKERDTGWPAFFICSKYQLKDVIYW